MGDWASDYDGYILIKFTKTIDYQNDFLNGKLFFNTADYFTECEEDGRGDPNEGNTFLINYNDPNLISANLERIDGQNMIVVRDYANNPSEYKRGTIWSYSSANNRYRKVFCLYTLYLNIQNGTVGKFSPNIAKDFGKYGILILNRREFFSRVSTAICREINNCKDAKMGFVEYVKTNPGLNMWHPFRKDKDIFESQNEFRITYVDDTTVKYKLDLGSDLRDIAVPILAEDIGKIQFEGGNLMYPTYR